MKPKEYNKYLTKFYPNKNDRELIKIWINEIQAEKASHSENTEKNYPRILNQFLTEINITPTQIKTEYKNNNYNRKTREKYTELIRKYRLKLKEKGKMPNTIRSEITTIKSFFTHNELDLGRLKAGQIKNGRPEIRLTKRIIDEIYQKTTSRQKAIHSIMIQGGIRPHSLIKLQIKDFKDILNEEPTIPQLITIPEEKSKINKEYKTFISLDAVKDLKNYIKEQKTPITEKDAYLFTINKGINQGKILDVTTPSTAFRRMLHKLRKLNKITTEEEKGIRLYSLRKYHYNKTKIHNPDAKKFMFGHKPSTTGQKYYYQTNSEELRQIYIEEAEPYLSIYTKPLDQHKNELTTLKNQVKELQQFKQKIIKMKQLIPLTEENKTEQEKQQEQQKYQEWQKNIKINPEDQKEYDEFMLKNPKEYERAIIESNQWHMEQLKDENKEMKERIIRLEKIMHDKK